MPRRSASPARAVPRLLAAVLAASCGLAVGATGAAAQALDPTPSATPDRIALGLTTTPQHRQAITWRTDEAVKSGRAEAVPVGDGPTTTADADSRTTVGFGTWTYTSRHHTAVLTGLRADTEYRYRVGDGDGERWSTWRRFRTARDDDPRPWSFLYFGDAQNDVLAKFAPVVRQAQATVPDAALAVHAGDLINNADQDHQWSEWFAATDGLSDTRPSVTTPGNHEYSGDQLTRQYGAHFPAGGTAGPMSSFYADHGGVRFVSVNANDKVPFLTGQQAFVRNALRDNPHRWAVVVAHQPVFSNSDGRDSSGVRLNWRSIYQEENVDLVLQGHDHTYGRGYVNADRTGTPGVTTGPVYVVANAGPKYYDLAPDDANDWTANDATRVVGYDQTSTFQHIRVEKNRLVYRSYAAAKGPEADAPGQLGDVVDAFTVTKTANGGKRVAEGADGEDGTETPAPEDGDGSGTPAPGDGDGSGTAGSPDPPGAGDGPGGTVGGGGPVGGPSPLPTLTVPGGRPGAATPRRAAVRWLAVRPVRRDGSVQVRVPAGGRLVVTSKARGARAFTTTRRVGRARDRAGTVALRLRPTAAAQRRLRRTGRLAVRLRLSFRDDGGRTRTSTRAVTLRRR
ncbi:purple acid phosphatase family protein [Patulibacter americanus]|uniref:purple acid phosphatase family protein n=1 Tax=Patulibacter americanus TaxID=588672 RepID=UPI0003B66B30|nr:metallophosphoesterase family protein [Patulibacter americanus]